MKRLVLGALLAVLLTACAAFSRAMPYLPTPNDLACAATQVENGVTDPVAIVLACPALAVVAAADIEALIMNLVMAKRAAHRAAAEHAADAGVRTLNFANDNDAGRR